MRTVKLTGNYSLSDTSPADLRLRFTPTSALKSTTENIVVLDRPQYAMTDGAGYFEVVLIPMQTGISPSQFMYLVEEIDGHDVVGSWHMRLDPTLPAEISLTAIYPSQKPAFQEVYPTLDDVTAIAGSLDNSLFTELTLQQAQLDNFATLLQAKVDHSDVGTVVPEMINGQVKPENLPVVRFQNTFPASSQSEMLGLVGVQKFDVVVRSDVGKTYVLMGSDPRVSTNWVPLDNAMGVTSVNGSSGAVLLSPSDIGAAPVVHDHETLSGEEYVAQRLRGSQVVAQRTLNIGDTGFVTTASNREIVWKDASGTEVYALRPHQVTPWITVPVQTWTSNGTLLPNAVVSFAVRKLNPDTAEVKITATNVTGQVYFTTTDAGINAAMTDVLIGSWVSQDAGDNLLASGVVAQRLKHVTPMGYAPPAASTKLQIKGTLPGVFLTTQAVYKPLSPDEQYELEIAAVDSGPLDATISGSYPHQQLHLTIPNGQVGPRGLSGPPGAAGPAGPPGSSAAGTVGKSAYQSWLDLGNTGTEADFIASLRGPAGPTGYNSGAQFSIDANGYPVVADPQTGTGALLLDANGYPYYDSAASGGGTIVYDAQGYPSLQT